MNGAPAKPISGVGPSSATSRRTAVCRNSSRSGSSGGSASTSATDRTGWATTGPTPGLISMSTPATTSGSTMSEKRMAASTPCRRTGCRVISVTRSGSWQASSIAVPARSARYSGRDRPAWRMNQTGVRLTGRPRAARTRSESSGRGRVTTGHPPRRWVTGCGASGRPRHLSPAAYPALVEPRSLADAAARGSDAGGGEPPAAFRAALEALAGVRARPEITLEHIPAPQRLAPFAAALAARVAEPDAGDDDDEIASARFIVLFDPDGHESWAGTTRCVGYLSAETDEQLVDDAMFSEVAWSWLTDALDETGATHHNVGGTVTRTASTRFGDLAGPEHTRRRRDARVLDRRGHRARPAPHRLAPGTRQRGRSPAARGVPAGSLRPRRRRDSLTSVPTAGRTPTEPVASLPAREAPARAHGAPADRTTTSTGERVDGN